MDPLIKAGAYRLKIMLLIIVHSLIKQYHVVDTLVMNS